MRDPVKNPVKNMGASVRARLLKIAKERGQTFDLLLTRYTLERLLYRLSTSPHKDNFVLKGAMLFTTWVDNAHRPTRDVDLLGFGASQPEAILAVFQEICGIAEDDGVIFDVAALRIERNRDDLAYGGLRVTTDALVGGAKIRVVIDIGFGDAVEPGLNEIELPILLDLPAPRLRAYPMETVISEKFQAMVNLGRANSRMKDFYDIWFLARAFTFEDDRLARAIVATFKRRNTEFPVEVPDALTDSFAQDDHKRNQWTAFVAGVLAEPVDLDVVIAELRAFLMPHAKAASKLAGE
ncbi:MAG: nucleotidyl transferase AbiEii/AbiGii toxin family protein [Alphaproteobacteria bacterium]|nr:nucleotidyl transferase AbiEii/AbiGii toxin family protein [Alphaproteobacteria bacterium]